MLDNHYLTIGILLWASYCLAHVWHKVFAGHGIPNTIPWPDNKSDFWSRGKSTLKSFLGVQSLIEDGYTKYSKNGRPFVLPNLIFGPEVIIPSNHMQWLVDQPDHVLSQAEASRVVVSADVTLLHPDILANRIHTPIIENEMNKKQDTYADEQIDEIQHVLHSRVGTDSTVWKEIPVFEFFCDLLPRVVARTFVGLPLCRDEKYLHSARAFNSKVPLVATFEQICVPIVRPLAVRLAHAYDMMHYRRLKQIILPIIAQRLPAFQSRYGNGMKTKSKVLVDFGPNDFVQWALKYSFRDNSFDPRTTPELITKQLAVMNFASSHSTALTLTNILFDIASYPDSVALQDNLRDEVMQVVARAKQENSDTKEYGRSNLARMVRLDSACRESLRRWGFSSRGVQKTVVAQGGITLPTGEHLPKGVKVGISGWPLHRDDDFYKDAKAYRPFRFCEEDNIAEIKNLYGEGKFPAGGATMTSTGDYYLVFSHGRWACPGRFFAQNNLKRIIAQIILSYDIEPLQERPTNMWFNHLLGPPMVETIRLRRRVGTV